MSSKATAAAAAKASAASDKVEVSFATDEEDGTSSEEETTSSSEESDDEEKSEEDGDADDESEMPTFTLSLQPSAGTADADDALPDLSASKQETVATKTVSVRQTETKVEEPVTSRLDVKVENVASDDAKASPSEPAVPTDEESQEESSKGSEESEEETTDEEDQEDADEQTVSSSATTTTVPSASVSTAIDNKENLTVSSGKTGSIVETQRDVKEVEEEHTAIVVVETKMASAAAEKTTKSNASVVTEVKEKSSSKKETVVTEKAGENVKISHEEISSVLSRIADTKSVKSEAADGVKAASVSSVPNSGSADENKKESVDKGAKPGNENSPSSNTTEANDLKQPDDGVKETQLSAVKSTEKETAMSSNTAEKTGTKHSTAEKAEEIKDLKIEVKCETVDNPKPTKSLKQKPGGKEVKQKSSSSAVGEEQKVAVTALTKQSADDSQMSVKAKPSETNTEASKPEVNPEKKRESHKLDYSQNIGDETKLEIKDKSKEIAKDVSNNADQATKIDPTEHAVNASAGGVNSEETASLPGKLELKGELPSKKTSEQSAAASKESELKSAPVEHPGTAVVEKTENVSETAAVVESVDSVTAKVAAASISNAAIIAAESKTEKNVAEVLSKKDKSPVTANAEDDAKLSGQKLNGVENDDTVVTAADDADFRPRRNSIDEFIKRILAEAREEQKKILDSCAVSFSGDTTSETSTPVRTADDHLPPSGATQIAHEQQQPIVNGVDVNLTTKTVGRNREDFDIDEELADISRYYAKRTLVDRVSTNGAERTDVDDGGKSKVVENGDGGGTLPPTSAEEVLHFVPQRRETTATVVRESSRPVKLLVDQQTSVIRQLSETSRAIDELDNEVRQLRQSTGGRDALYASIGAAIRDEVRAYELELMSVGERIGQQRLPGGGRFIREQFVAQCATELLLNRSAGVTNGPRLERAATVDDWVRVGRRRSGSFSAPVDDDAGGGGLRSGIRQWLPTAPDRDTTDLMIQYRHSRSGSVVSDRGFSSVDTVDESRATTSSLISRLAAFNATEPDFARYSRASSEAPRPSYSRPQTSDDWASATNSAYSVGRHFDSTEDSNEELDIGYRVSAARAPAPPSYRRYHPPPSTSVVTPSLESPSRLYVRRGSLQGYSSYEGGPGSDVSRSFNSRFLSRVREKKALGDTASRPTSVDKPFRSRFLKSSSVTGSTSTTYSSSVGQSRFVGHFEADED